MLLRNRYDYIATTYNKRMLCESIVKSCSQRHKKVFSVNQIQRLWSDVKRRNKSVIEEIYESDSKIKGRGPLKFLMRKVQRRHTRQHSTQHHPQGGHRKRKVRRPHKPLVEEAAEEANDGPQMALDVLPLNQVPYNRESESQQTEQNTDHTHPNVAEHPATLLGKGYRNGLTRSRHSRTTRKISEFFPLQAKRVPSDCCENNHNNTQDLMASIANLTSMVAHNTTLLVDLTKHIQLRSTSQGVAQLN